MSLAHVLLEDGAEIDLDAEMREVISILEDEVPGFICENYGYQVCSLSGVLGVSWHMLVNLVDRSSATTEFPPRIGLIELNTLEGGSVNLRVIPRDPWREDEARVFGEEGRFFANFVFQLVNTLRAQKYISVPGSTSAL